MPQMMPLSWIMLYMFFIIILFTFSFINYYSFIPLPLLKEKKMSSKIMNWKW
uniref:ATP synthase complex subunit 8 n=1 Tax=Panesthia tryoni tegminifera TaxID=112960 RepID=A0A8K1HPZ5_9NEOP|nr:ATP synthase F0 subunit 8 [Panesthia tryoni tegminifera]